MRERYVPWHKGATRRRGCSGCLIQSGSECSNYRLDLAHMPSHGEGRTFEPRGPGPPVGRGRGHGSGASSASPTAPTAHPSLPLNSPKNQKFSNHWKNIFQSLENSRFPDELPDWPKPGCLAGWGTSAPPSASSPASPAPCSGAPSSSDHRGRHARHHAPDRIPPRHPPLRRLPPQRPPPLPPLIPPLTAFAKPDGPLRPAFLAERGRPVWRQTTE